MIRLTNVQFERLKIEYEYIHEHACRARTYGEMKRLFETFVENTKYVLAEILLKDEEHANKHT